MQLHDPVREKLGNFENFRNWKKSVSILKKYGESEVQIKKQLEKDFTLE